MIKKHNNDIITIASLSYITLITIVPIGVPFQGTSGRVAEWTAVPQPMITIYSNFLR